MSGTVFSVHPHSVIRYLCVHAAVDCSVLLPLLSLRPWRTRILQINVPRDAMQSMIPGREHSPEQTSSHCVLGRLGAVPKKPDTKVGWH